MKYQMIIFAVMISSFAIAQQNINVDDPNNRNIVNLAGINGEPVSMFKYNRIVEGSVFLPTDFADAMIFIKFNKRPLTAKAKLNVMDRNLHYLDQQGHEMLTKMAIEEIQFKDPATGNLLVFTTMIECNTANSGWYEIIEKGKVSLYREITKTITENKPYGSATTEQKVNTFYKYWMKTATGCKQINKIKDFIAELKQINPGFENMVSGHKYSDKELEDWRYIAKLFNAN